MTTLTTLTFRRADASASSSNDVRRPTFDGDALLSRRQQPAAQVLLDQDHLKRGKKCLVLPYHLAYL